MTPKPNDPTSAIDPSPVQAGARAQARSSGPLPEHIGAYRVLRELGHGGMGVVYLATRDDVALNRLVALKLVHRGMASSGVLERFERERQVLGALNHPNIARLLDGGTSERGEPFFVMEYVEGRPIDEYCDARRLTIAERLALFRQVCGAVQHAHQNLVVHRDIKPRNILVTAEGVPKLLDFGIAKLLNPSMAPSLEAPTQTGLRLMTPEYASPEQVKGLPITTATDVYSLGVVLFELLTGHRPYRLRTRVYHEVERIICEEEPQKPSTAITRVEEIDRGGDAAPEGAPAGAEPGAGTKHAVGGSQMITPEAVGRARRERPPRLRRALEGDIDNIVLMALRKEPQRRYTSVEQFADDIRRHLEGHTVIARADTPGYRAAKFVRRHRAAVLAAGLVAVALLAGLTTTLWQWRAADANARALERSNAELRSALDAKDALANKTLARTEGIMTDGIAAIARLPNSIEAQQWFAALVQSWLQEIEGLVGAGNDARLRETMAESWHRFGATQSSGRSQNEGDVGAALTSHRRGHDIRDALVRESPSDPGRRINLAESKLHLADAMRQRDPQGNREASEREIGAALALAEAAATELGVGSGAPATPETDHAADVLARILGFRADMELQAGRLDEARDFALRGLGLIQQNFVDRLDDAGPRARIASSNYRLAQIERAAKRLGSALDHVEDSVKGYEALADSVGGVSHERGVMNARRLLSDIRRSMGDEERALGDEALAQQQFLRAAAEAEAAVAMSDRLFAEPQLDVRPRLDRALCRQAVGLARYRLGDLDGAAENFRLASEDAEAELAKGARAHTISLAAVRLMAASASQSLAETLLEMPRGEDVDREAVESARRAFDHYSKRVKPGKDPMSDDNVLRATAYLGLALKAAGERTEGRLPTEGRLKLEAARDGYRRADEKKTLGDFEKKLLERIERELK